MKIDANTALVLEGGGLRGVFTCGVLDCFMDRGVEFGRIEKDTSRLATLYQEGYDIASALQILSEAPHEGQ